MNTNGMLTLREVSVILKIDRPKYDPSRKTREFLNKIEKQRNVKVLFKLSENGNYYTTLVALKEAIPEAFQIEKINKESFEIKEDVSAETFELIKDLVNDLKDQINLLKSKNNNMQAQLIKLSTKYNDLEFKYNSLKVKNTED